MLSQLLKKYQKVDISKIRSPTFLKTQNDIEINKIQRIQQGTGWKEVKQCPLCHSTEKSYELIKHEIEMFACNQCGVRYSSKIAANLDEVYKSSQYLSYSIEDSDENFNYRMKRFGKERVNILEKYCGDLTHKKILDVGCGNGYFLAAAMAKCKHCFGSEFSEKLREFSRKKTGLPIFGEKLEQLPEKHYDIITIFDVIEHIPDPMPFMNSVDALLNKGGAILIFTPNFDSFSIRVMREFSSIIDPIEHIVLYTIPSLQYLAKIMTYEVTYHETQGLDIYSILSMQQYKGEKLNEFLKNWNGELQAMINATQCGDYGRILIKKPS